MSTHDLTHALDQRAEAAPTTWRVRMISALGPLTALGGALWAVLQPERITLLHPRGEGFWWLFIQPPILVVLVGLLFHIFVSRKLIEDLQEHDAAA